MRPRRPAAWLLTALVSLSCASPVGRPPCRGYEGRPRLLGEIAVIRTEAGCYVSLIDARWHEGACDSTHVLLAPGRHALHISCERDSFARPSPYGSGFQRSGAVLEFEAQAGHRYFVSRNSSGSGVEIQDRLTGESVQPGSWRSYFHPEAEYEVARVLAECGLPVDLVGLAENVPGEDPVDTYVWIRLAEKSGSSVRSGRMAEVTRRMSSSQLEEAEARFERIAAGEGCRALGVGGR